MTALTGQAAILTGAGGGLGSATATLTECGSTVIPMSLDGSATTATAQGIESRSGHSFR